MQSGGTFSIKAKTSQENDARNGIGGLRKAGTGQVVMHKALGRKSAEQSLHDPLLQVQKLAASGIKTFIVGFYADATTPSGVGIGFLNDMACAGQTASTMWTLNCMGCHAAPVGHVSPARGWRAQFAQTPSGRVFFMDVPLRGAVLSSDDDARLMREILTWKASCHVILQQAPSVSYTGLDHVK